MTIETKNERPQISSSRSLQGVAHLLGKRIDISPLRFQRCAVNPRIFHSFQLLPWGCPKNDTLSKMRPCAVCHGSLLSGGQFIKVDFPDTASTIGGGLNPQGDNAGSYNNGLGHGFLLSDGDYTSIDFPGATFTNTNAINARGDIVGRYVAGGVSHGYLLSGGQFSTIDFPGATFTAAASINQRGDIVGRYVMDGVTHAFLLAGFRSACVVAMSTPRIAAVTHSSDFTLVNASKPAAAGEVLVLFAKGLGPTRPSVSSGQPFPSSLLAPSIPWLRCV